MINYKYNFCVKITPLDYYFFGGEKTFGNGDQQNYFAETRLLPQQTSIVGLLRHLGYNKVDIGESFDPTEPEIDQNFGYLSAISPLFLIDKENHYYIPGPLGKGENGAFPISRAEDNIKCWNGDSWSPLPQAKQYTAKKGWEQGLMVGKPFNPERDYLSFQSVFKTFIKVGITKRVGENDPKDSFYKQYLAKLNRGWSFAVLASIDEQLVKELPRSTVLPFGAEKALFHIQLEPLGDSLGLENYFPKSRWQHDFPNGLDAFVLLSDAWVDEKINSVCHFSITSVKHFRNIRTPKQSKDFASLLSLDEWKKGNSSNNPHAIKHIRYKSAKYNLISRGSILYGDASQITSYLDQKAFQNIGYNHYYQLTK